MRVGNVYFNKDEKGLKKDLEYGYEIMRGVSIRELLDRITIIETQTINPSEILANLKAELLIGAGIIEVKDENKKDNK